MSPVWSGVVVALVAVFLTQLGRVIYEWLRGRSDRVAQNKQILIALRNELAFNTALVGIAKGMPLDNAWQALMQAGDSRLLKEELMNDLRTIYSAIRGYIAVGGAVEVLQSTPKSDKLKGDIECLIPNLEMRIKELSNWKWYYRKAPC